MPILTADPLLPLLDAGKPEVIVSAALTLMSTYGCSDGCPKLARVIVRHLRILAERSDLAPVLRETCARLVDQWEAELRNKLPAARAPGASGRIFSFRRKVH